MTILASKRPALMRPLPRVSGMTLIELVVVIVLIGLVLAVVGGKVVKNKHIAEARLAVTALTTLAGQIDSYKSDVGQYPDSLEQLVAPPGNAPGWLGPYADTKELKDPWQNPIQYNKPGDDGKPFQLLSLGVDGKSGGDGVDKDIVAP
jgi:general secretion pathway protein G